MNEEQVLEQLRDIHVPAALERTVNTDFALWPFAVLALIVSLILLTRLWNGGRWRRHAKAELCQILSNDNQETQWSQLLKFATDLSARSGRPLTLPEAAFMPPDTLSEQQKTDFVKFLNAQLER